MYKASANLNARHERMHVRTLQTACLKHGKGLEDVHCQQAVSLNIKLLSLEPHRDTSRARSEEAAAHVLYAPVFFTAARFCGAGATCFSAASRAARLARFC